MAGKYFVMSIDRCCPRSLPSIAGDVTEDQTAYDTLYHWHATGSGVVNTPNLRRLLKKDCKAHLLTLIHLPPPPYPSLRRTWSLC